jgi:hypothetical protein
MGVRRWRIVQQPTNFKRATGTFEIVYPTQNLIIPFLSKSRHRQFPP